MAIEPNVPEKDYTVEPLTGYDVLVKDYFFDMRVTVTGLLDPERLVQGLHKLITEKWQVIGSRVVSLPNNQYELRIPKEFNEKQPAILFEAFEASEEVTLAECFNRLTNLDNIQQESDLIAFSKVMQFKKDADKKLTNIQPISNLAKQCQASKFGPIRLTTKEHIDSGMPLITVLVYQFPNSGESVVRVFLPHCVFDATNIAAFFRAWSNTLNDKFESVPSILPLSQVPEFVQTEQSKITKKDLKRFDLFYATPFAILTLFTFLFFRWIVLPLLQFRKPSYQSLNTVFIPDKAIEGWRSEASEYAKANGYPKETFLSINDLVNCWAMQKFAKNTSILDGFYSFSVAFNLRTQSPTFASKLGIDLSKGDSLSLALKNANKFFPHNGFVFVGSGKQLWCKLNQWPKWAFAYKIRQLVNDARKPENRDDFIQKMALINSNHLIPSSPALLQMDPRSQFAITTSWAQSDIVSAIDFSSALIESKNKPKDSWAASIPPGKVSDLTPLEAKLNNGMPPFGNYTAILTIRPGKGVLVGITCDPHIIDSGEFGRKVNLDNVY